MSGYLWCACRDCLDTAIGEPGALCAECKDAGCIPAEWDEPSGDVKRGTEFDCQREDAYQD